MTDIVDQNETTEDVTEGKASRRAILGLTGAGIAGAVVMGSSVAKAANGESVLLGVQNDATLPTEVENTNNPAAPQTPGTGGGEAVKGVISGTNNGSHAILGVTDGKGHAVAGVIGTPTDPGSNTVGATWGRHYGQGASVEGDSRTVDSPLAGPANAVKGTIQSETNNSHAILGITKGGGHAVAGVIGSADADGSNIVVPTSTVAATWGRHYGPAAAVEGQQLAENIAIADPGNAVKGLIEKASNGAHAILGVTEGGGHSVAGDTPATAMGPLGVGPNTTAATWGRHGGVGAGIGGVSANGYGGEFVGGLASVRLIPSEGVDEGAPTDGDHKAGELFVDGNGDLFYNTGDGLNFKRLNEQALLDPGPGVIKMLDAPMRAYDSRAAEPPASSQKGKFSDKEIRTIDLTTETNFPAGASAAVLNVTVTETERDPRGGPGGFVTVYSASLEERPLISTLNWGAPDLILSNGATIAVDSAGKIKVYCHAQTHLVIDVMGYVG